MTKHNPIKTPPTGESTSPAHHCGPAEELPSAPDSGPDDDWDEGPPRRTQAIEEEDQEEDHEYYDHYAIGERHLRLVEKLIKLTHPLASEYLTNAQAVSPDAPGRERIINLGCRLVTSTHQLITVSARLRDVD